MAIPTKDELGFDPDALREKYRTERDKRLRADANEQIGIGRGPHALPRSIPPKPPKVRVGGRN